MVPSTSFFKVTSDAPYDRHNYEVMLKNNKKVFFENWEDVQVYWYQNFQIPDFLDVIIVKDKKKVKSKGFAQ
jgi:hypothetical protein